MSSTITLNEHSHVSFVIKRDINIHVIFFYKLRMLLKCIYSSCIYKVYQIACWLRSNKFCINNSAYLKQKRRMLYILQRQHPKVGTNVLNQICTVEDRDIYIFKPFLKCFSNHNISMIIITNHMTFR
jgi:hypothetical protein